MALVVKLNFAASAPPALFAMLKLGTTTEPAVVDDAMKLLVAVIAVAVPLVSVDVPEDNAPEVTAVALPMSADPAVI